MNNSMTILPTSNTSPTVRHQPSSSSASSDKIVMEHRIASFSSSSSRRPSSSSEPLKKRFGNKKRRSAALDVIEEQEDDTKVIRWKAQVEYSDDDDTSHSGDEGSSSATTSTPPAAASVSSSGSTASPVTPEQAEKKVLLGLSSAIKGNDSKATAPQQPRRMPVSILKRHNASTIPSRESPTNNNKRDRDEEAEAQPRSPPSLPLKKQKTSNSKIQMKHRLAPTSAEDFKYELERMEAKIKQAARIELTLLNKAKMLRDKRRLLSDKYTKYSKIYQNKLESNGKKYVPMTLPPLMPE